MITPFFCLVLSAFIKLDILYYIKNGKQYLRNTKNGLQ